MASARLDKRRAATLLSRYTVNPAVRTLHRLGLPWPGTAILETTGRRSGEPRRTPVGDGRVGEEFWIVAEHGLKAAYVRNILADPRVRIRTGGRWRTGTARVVEGDDPRERIRWLAERRGPALRLNGAVVRAMQTEPAVIRVDLDAST